MKQTVKTSKWVSLFSVVLLLSGALSACSKNPDFDQELVKAAKKGDMQSVTHALENGADVSARDPKFHATALMWASHWEHLDIMRILMQHGATVDAKGGEGETALWFTAQQGRLQAMKLLVENGADPTVVGRDGQSAYAVAAAENHPEITAYLQSLGITE